MTRTSMDWRKLLYGMAVRFQTILRKEHTAETDLPKCYIIDDTTLEKSGIAMEHISRVFDHVKGRCVLGFVGLAKMRNTKYKVADKLHCAAELIALHERTDIHECRKYKCLYISMRGTLGSQQVRIFLIRYGHNQRWNILLTSDTTMSFVKAFEIYQIRWNIEVLNKEAKQYLGLGSYQGRDFDGQIADCTICFITYIVMALEKRFSDYETMGELFAYMEDDVAALTLWKRMLECIRHLLNALCRHLGITVDELAESIINDDEAANDYFVMAKALEDSKSA